MAPSVLIGPTWTTDAPFRETGSGHRHAARARGILAVEMEAAGLYAFAQARQRAVICPRACHQPDGDHRG